MKSLYFSLPFLLLSCTTKSDQPLPILGEKIIEGTDTLYHTIPDFSFINQNGDTITPATFQDKIYIVDFFFTACPTICPLVKAQMLRIYEKFQNEDRIILLSHTIDPKRDTPEKLLEYATNLGISAPKWHLVTGEKEKIYSIATSYFSVALEDESAPGGFDHSGRLILVDQNKRVRSFCDGTDAKSVDQFLIDIQTLLNKG